MNFRHAMMVDLDPQDNSERFLAEQIIAQRWYLMHVNESESAAMRKAFEVYSRIPVNPEGLGYDQSHTEDERNDHALAKTATADEVQLILRYRTTHERGLKRMEDLYRYYQTKRELNERRDEENARKRGYADARSCENPFSHDEARNSRAGGARNLNEPDPGSASGKRSGPNDLRTDFRISPSAFQGKKSIPLEMPPDDPATDREGEAPAEPSSHPSRHSPKPEQPPDPARRLVLDATKKRQGLAESPAQNAASSPSEVPNLKSEIDPASSLSRGERAGVRASSDDPSGDAWSHIKKLIEQDLDANLPMRPPRNSKK